MGNIYCDASEVICCSAQELPFVIRYASQQECAAPCDTVSATAEYSRLLFADYYCC